METKESNTPIVETRVYSQQEEAILGILSDCIIWERIGDGMFIAVNAFNLNANEYEFEPQWEYHGYSNVFRMLNIYDKDALVDKLSTNFQNHYNSKERADVLAKKIYDDWMKIIAFDNALN